MSHPVWVRGLKHKYKWFCSVGFVVAPRVGAWIETEMGLKQVTNMEQSHPVWVRGLKRT